METDWRAVGQALESVGVNLKFRCDDMEAVCEGDPKFERMYLWFVMMLDMLRMWSKWIDAQYDVIDVGYTDVVI